MAFLIGVVVAALGLLNIFFPSFGWKASSVKLPYYGGAF